MPSQRDSLPPLSLEAIRVVLAMLVEIGALKPLPAGVSDRWQDLRLALFGPDQFVSDDQQGMI